jgi:hypothetical protein
VVDDVDSDAKMFTAELDDILGPQSIDLAECAPAIPPLPEFNLDLICEIMSFSL